MDWTGTYNLHFFQEFGLTPLQGKQFSLREQILSYKSTVPGCGSKVWPMKCILSHSFHSTCGWLGGAMALSKLAVPGRSTIWTIVGQGPTALAIGAGGVVGHFYSHLSFLSFVSLSLETARYRLKYCLKGPLNSKQPPSGHFNVESTLNQRQTSTLKQR